MFCQEFGAKFKERGQNIYSVLYLSVFNTSQAYKNRSHIHIFQVFQCLDKGLHNLQHKLDELTGDYVVNGETAANYKHCCVTA